ncbi:hypothetical protein JBE04_44930, partial [Streptomyces sp. PRKS01-29]
TIITALRSTVRSREAELAGLRAQGERENGETARAAGDRADLNRVETPVSHLPRRMLTEPERPGAEVSRTDLPGADELWADGSQPAVLDLRMIDTAMVLPNYEVDRRVG